MTPRPDPYLISRRAFLGGAVLGGVELLLPGSATRPKLTALVLPGPGPRPVRPFGPTTYTVTVRRVEDQCVLTMEFYNLQPDFTQSPPALAQVSPYLETLLVVTFPPQSVIEDAYVLSAPPGLSPEPAPAHGLAPPTPSLPTSSPATPPVNAYLAGASRVAFLIAPAGTTVGPIPLETSSLLDWVDYTLNVVPNAVPPGQFPAGYPGPARPSSTQTAIELPYHLQLSPDATQTFVNATAPVTSPQGWTELWHTRLAGVTLLVSGPLTSPTFVRIVDETDRTLRNVRAVWCTDPNFHADLGANAVEPAHPTAAAPDGTAVPFSLQYTDRYDIVRLSSDFSLASPPRTVTNPYNGDAVSSSAFLPAPATADSLILSSLGGWLDADANWDLPYEAGSWNTSLLQWRHRATQARDSYVRVVRKGYIFPFGHRASLVTVTERQPSHIGDNTARPVGAYLRQQIFLVIGQPVKDYMPVAVTASPAPAPASVNPPGLPNGGRQFPFTSVKVLTLVTPDLEGEVAYYGQANPELSFQPTLGGAPYLFHFQGTDWAGGTFDFHAPVVWVDDTIAYGESDTSAPEIDRIITQWRASGPPTVSFDNARIAVAAPKEPTVTAGDTQVVVTGLTLDAEHADDGTGVLDALILASQPHFYPTVSQMQEALPDAGAISGNPVTGPSVQYESNYLSTGFDPTNVGGIFLATIGTGPTVQFNASSSGGAVTPNVAVDGRSREIGPAPGDLSELRAGTFNPQNVFKGVNARLLGGLQLQAILEQVNFGNGDNRQALQITSIEQYGPDGSVVAVVTTLDWHPVITSGGPYPGVTVFEITNPDPAPDEDQESNSFDLHAVIFTDLVTPANSTSTVTGQIRDFNIDLFGNSGPSYFLQIPFDSLTFRAQTGQKTDVAVQVSSSGVSFQGALSFVQTLADYLAFDGSGLTVDTAGSAITITLTLAIPSIGVGVFSLQNLAFSAGCSIPYDGDPVRFNFAFCSRENPFQLTIMMFGGGGFVALSIGVDGVEVLELGFDFGAGISLDLGVASGQISLMGGIYFEVQTQNDANTPHAQDVDLTAYVKASGGVSALGVISVSVELYLALSYQQDGSNSCLSGEAEMSIAVHIIFFGFSVGFSVQKTFAGSDPPGAVTKASVTEASTARASIINGMLDPPYTTNTFGSAMPYDQWAQYCSSFALIGVGG